MWQQHVCLINRRFSPPSQHSGSIFFGNDEKVYTVPNGPAFFFPKGYCYLISIAQCINAQFTLVIVDGCKGL